MVSLENAKLNREAYEYVRHNTGNVHMIILGIAHIIKSKHPHTRVQMEQIEEYIKRVTEDLDKLQEKVSP